MKKYIIALLAFSLMTVNGVYAKGKKKSKKAKTCCAKDCREVKNCKPSPTCVPMPGCCKM